MVIIKKNIRANRQSYAVTALLIIFSLFFQIFTGGAFLNPLNITTLIIDNSYILILSLGMMLVLISANIDLSVGAAASLMGVFAAILLNKWELPMIFSLFVILAAGAAAGAFQGWWVAYLRIPSFVITIAGMFLLKDIDAVLVKSVIYKPYPDIFQTFSFGFIPDIFKGNGFHITTIFVGLLITAVYLDFDFSSRKSRTEYDFDVLPLPLFRLKILFFVIMINAVMFLLAKNRGMPNVLVLMLLLTLLYSFITSKTVIGRHLYALGCNITAAQLSGVKTRFITFLAFANMGMMAALSGFLFSPLQVRGGSGTSNLFELDAITASFIGGASTTGGGGSIVGADLGGLLMAVLNNGMSQVGIDVDWQLAIKGGFLLVAVAYAHVIKAKAEYSVKHFSVFKETVNY